jgi:hypothetical protein
MSAMHPRTVALIGALTLAAGWALGGRFGTPSPGDRPGGAVSRGPRPLGLEQAMPTGPFTERLRQKLEQQPKGPRSSRNPFSFGARRGSVPDAGRPAPAPALEDPPVEPAAPPPAGPMLSLSGMASNPSGDGIEYTAIVSDGAGLHFVKQGDTLPGGYTVVDVQETMITLRDESGGERTLRLR